MSHKLSILHITPHLGGGIGSVVLNWVKKDNSGNSHIIVSLDENNNKDWKEIDNHFELITIHENCFVRKDFNVFLKISIEQADIIIIHYWNHPLLYDVMINFQWPSCRLLLWCHINGLFPPYTIPEKLLNFVDYFIFTSPVSYECNAVKNLSNANRGKIGVIWSTVGTDGFDDLEKVPHDSFNVGYIGTADFGKLNPNFVNLCSQVNIPDVRFIVISQDPQQHLINEAIDADVWEKFTFLGHVPRIPSIPRVLSKIDVFAYPLQPKNFATCEQALGEAMMAGCVPVVFANLPEKHIVRHMETGMIAVTLEEYPRAIEYLYKNSDVFARISKNAQDYARKQYDINKTISDWNKTFEVTMKLEKRGHIWDSMKIENHLPYELYIESLGGASGYGSPFFNYLNASDTNSKKKAVSEIQILFRSNSVFFSRTKGSVMHYHQFFPEDNVLSEWEKLIIEKREK